MIGKFGCSITFTIVFNISAEMFPTIVRNNAVGVSSMVSRIGGVITPYVALIVSTLVLCISLYCIVLYCVLSLHCIVSMHIFAEYCIVFS